MKAAYTALPHWLTSGGPFSHNGCGRHLTPGFKQSGHRPLSYPVRLDGPLPVERPVSPPGEERAPSICCWVAPGHLGPPAALPRPASWDFYSANLDPPEGGSKRLDVAQLAVGDARPRGRRCRRSRCRRRRRAGRSGRGPCPTGPVSRETA